MNNDHLLYLSKSDVQAAGVEMKTIIQLVEQAFIEKAQGQVEMPPKIGIHTQPEAFSHAMPAYLPKMQSAGMKWVSSYPGNGQLGLPNISGLIVLSDEKTGFPIAVMDATWITAARTGAATALSARYLANPDSHTVGIIACGVQGRSNLAALAELFPLQRVFAFDTNPTAQTRYVEEMQVKLGIEIIGVESPLQAIQASELVVTSGPIQKHASPVIQRDWLKPGTFASSVDFGSYFSRESLEQMAKICTDDLEQYRAYQKAGYFDHVPDPGCDLGDLVSGRKPGREQPDERTIAINLGLAIEDLAVAYEVFKKARASHLGTWLPL